MKTSLISLSLGCAVMSSCQYRPNNFFANKAAESGISAYDSASVSSYTPHSGGGNFLHRQGATSGSWDAAIGNFVLSNGSTFEIGKEEGAVEIEAALDNLEIIDLSLTNIHGGRSYSIDLEELKKGSVTQRVEKGIYRINIGNRWEVNATSAPQGTLTLEW